MAPLEDYVPLLCGGCPLPLIVAGRVSASLGGQCFATDPVVHKAMLLPSGLREPVLFGPGDQLAKATHDNGPIGFHAGQNGVLAKL